MGFVDESEDHDDFNPIQDLMPAMISDADSIGKKRTRDDDPLRRLLEDPALENAVSDNKRQKITH